MDCPRNGRNRNRRPVCDREKEGFIERESAHPHHLLRGVGGVRRLGWTWSEKPSDDGGQGKRERQWERHGTSAGVVLSTLVSWAEPRDSRCLTKAEERAASRGRK